MGMAKTLKTISFLLFITGFAGSLPANNKTSTKASGTEYLLPTNVKPSTYRLTLELSDDFHETKKFTGSLEIDVDVAQTTKEITLHAIDISIAEQAEFTVDVETKKDVEMIVLKYKNDIPAGEYTIKINSFTGRLRTEDMYGFYLSSYEKTEGDKKVTEWVATTQFQATHARKAFPCFDEPDFKAIFEITIKHPVDYIALANTKISSTKTEQNVVTDVFGRTPTMSTYLIAFIVSKFKGYAETKLAQTDPKYDVYCREEAIDTAKYSYEVGEKILAKLDEYTKINYYDMDAIEKMHQVAIPDFAAGAMENWGLVTYRETALLWDPEESTTSYKARVATVIAHEFAHMWFGDLVTLKWWSSTWLNEGFARYLQYYITKEVETNWELEKQFVVEQQQAIFVSDAISSSLPLNSDVYSPNEISNKFGSVSYNKGASVIRMMNFIMGVDKFKEGIQDYLRENAYKNTEPAQLWAKLNPKVDLGSDFDFTKVMEAWTDKSGFPVVTVTMNEGNAQLTQKRFLYSSDSTDNTEWYVPITYTTSQEKKFDKDNTHIQWLIPGANLEIEDILQGESGWVIVNLNQNGYYRVNYDDGLWDQLDEGLKKTNFDGIDVINRAQIVDDVFNLARAQIVTYQRALGVTSYLENEVEYYPWYAAFSAFSYIQKRKGEDEYLQTHIRTMMNKLFKSVSFDVNNDGDHITVLKTSLAVQWACNTGIEDCTTKANELFKKYKEDGTKIDPNLRSAVYCSALRQSTDEADWNFLWEKFLSTDLASEQVTILNALGCTKIEALLTDYLAKSITENSGIRKQDARSVFNAVLSGNLNGVNVAYKFFTENIEKLSAYYGGMNDLSNIINSMADRFTTEEQINNFESFAEEHKELLKDGEKEIANAIENARANLKWKQQELDDWLSATYGSASPIAINVSLLLTIVFAIFYNVL